MHQSCGYSNKTRVCAHGQPVRDRVCVALRIQNIVICRGGELMLAPWSGGRLPTRDNIPIRFWNVGVGGTGRVESHVVQAGLRFNILLRMTLNSQHFCLQLTSPGIKRGCHHTTSISLLVYISGLYQEELTQNLCWSPRRQSLGWHPRNPVNKEQ